MSRLQALLWDVDGTLAETEAEGHRVAFNAAFAAHGLPWQWDDARYAQLLAVTGGRERLLHDMQARADAPADPATRAALAAQLHATKNRLYAERVQTPGIPLRPGVAALIEAAAARGWRQAIATTTSRANLDALLRVHLGADWAQRFDAVVCGEDVARKKPDPEVYAIALARLRLPADAALAIEDAPPGVAAARAAGIAVIVTRSRYFADAPVPGACAVGPGLHTRAGWTPPAAGGRAGAVDLDDLAAWHAAASLPEPATHGAPPWP